MIDTVERKVIVNHSFLRDLVKILSTRHSGPNSYNQAIKVYLSQCRKSDLVKEGIRKVNKDLVDKGFTMKLDEMEPTRR